MDESTTHPTYVYYDGWCSACIKSAKLFNKLDKDRSILKCVDFRKADDPRLALAGIDPATFATSLHTRTPDGTLHSGPEAIRQAFTILGQKHSVSWTALPIIRPFVDACYRAFARNRLKWFGKHMCMEGTCAVNPNNDDPNTEKEDNQSSR